MHNSELYDTHCHLDFSEFDYARDDLVKACQQENITKLLVPSVTAESWEGVLAMARRYDQVSCALGLHPLFIKQHSIKDIHRLSVVISENVHDVVAIGEIGLDADAGNMALQVELFSKQLVLAQELGLPVIMHARRTHSQILSELKKVEVTGVIHAFSGSRELLKQYVDKGVGIGVGCVITWPTAKRTREAIASAPLDSLLLETDSPDMRVSSCGRNEFGNPLDVGEVFSALCEIRSESAEYLARALRENADRAFFQRA